jgi:hypothetical protein
MNPWRVALTAHLRSVMELMSDRLAVTPSISYGARAHTVRQELSDAFGRVSI